MCAESCAIELKCPRFGSGVWTDDDALCMKFALVESNRKKNSVTTAGTAQRRTVVLRFCALSACAQMNGRAPRRVSCLQADSTRKHFSCHPEYGFCVSHMHAECSWLR
eukprot:3695623-Rhodomonas_salina.5